MLRLEVDLPFGARVENVGVGIANALAFEPTVYVVISDKPTSGTMKKPGAMLIVALM